MAGKKENIKALFSNSRSRVIIVFTAILLVITITIGFIKFGSSSGGHQTIAKVGHVAGGIRATPGSQNQTAQYAALQSAQNVEQAQLARQKGTSAIPTIIHTHAFDGHVQLIGQKEGQGGVDFSALTQSDEYTQKSAWIQSLKNSKCSQTSLRSAIAQGIALSDLKGICSCKQLKEHGYKVAQLEPVCTCTELKSAGFDLVQLKGAGFTAERLRLCGYVACDEKGVGFTAQQMKDAGFTDGELKGAGFSEQDIARAGGLPDGMTADDVRKAGCGQDELTRLRAAGVTSAAIRRISGCSPANMKAAGFTATDLRNAGLSAADLKNAGFSPADLKHAGFSAADLKNAGFSVDDLTQAGFQPSEINAILPLAARKPANCDVASLQAARAAGVTAETIKKTLGCSAKAMKDAGYSAADLKNAGFTAAELKNAGFGVGDLKAAGYSAKDLKDAGWTANQLRDAGFSASQLKNGGFDAQLLKDAGFSAEQLKAAGFNASNLKSTGFTSEQLKAAGFSASELKEAGFSADELRKAGYSAKDLKAAGFSQDQLKKTGFSNQDLRDAGFSALIGLDSIVAGPEVSSTLPGLPTAAASPAAGVVAAEAASLKRIDDLRRQQEKQIAAQRYQQKVQQRSSAMLAAANQALQGWKTVPTQVYAAGTVKEEVTRAGMVANAQSGASGLTTMVSVDGEGNGNATTVVRTGDVLFAVIDTSVNSDEPGPILATIVSGRLKGGKLIGSFNLPGNAEKMIVTFNTLSMPGADKTVSVTAFAIDPNTARTALSSQTDHHYLERYGALFASTFIEGFGNAFQSANTTITIGGTGGTTDTTVQSGIGRSTMENAVIGLATVGKAWGQVAAQNMHRPTTVQLFAGTGVGVLFTQDLKIT